MRELVISAGLAYVLSGLAQVTKDLGSPIHDRPGWARRPTIGVAVLVALTWVIHPFIDTYYDTGQRGRAAVFGLLGVLVQMSVLTAFVWGCLIGAHAISDSTFWVVVLSAAFMLVGTLIVLPLANLVVMFLILLLSWPLDLLFPLTQRPPPPEHKDSPP